MITIEKNIIQSLALFMAIKDVRYYFLGMHVISDGTTVRIEATNGHGLVVYKFETDIPLEYDFIIPRDVIDFVLKSKPLAKSSYIQITPTTIGYSYNVQVPFTKIDGVFPSCSRVWPDDSQLCGAGLTVLPEYYALLGKIVKLLNRDKYDFNTWFYKDKLAFQVGDIKGIIMAIRDNAEKPRIIGVY